MQIRKARKDDIYDIHQIEKTCFSTPWGRESLESEMDYEDGIMLVACDENDRAIGYVSLRFVLDEGYMNNIAVLPEHRRNGTATALLNALAEKCREEGLSFITLEVRYGNEAAKALYSSLGYAITGKRRRFYRLPEEDALIYTLTL